MPIVFYILSILALIAADQLSKLWAVTQLRPVGVIPVLGDFLQFAYAENTGAAFSFLENHNQRWLFVSVTAVLVLACLVVLFSRRVRGAMGVLSLILIVSGGVGNMLDRIFRGYVVDFVYFKFIHFAIFNFADSCAVIGAVLLCVYLLFGGHGAELGGKKAPAVPGEKAAGGGAPRDARTKKETP